jgi:hypothetical protein
MRLKIERHLIENKKNFFLSSQLEHCNLSAVKNLVHGFLKKVCKFVFFYSDMN